MPYKNPEDKRAHGRKYSKDYFHRRKNDPKFREDRKKRLKIWREKNREYVNDYHRKYLKKTLEKLSDDELRKFREKKNEYATEYRKKWHDAIINHYGGKCVCCGEIERCFLTIDHIEGGGNNDFKTNAITVYKRMIEEDNHKKYRVLCWNCNIGRRINRGVCPHKK